MIVNRVFCYSKNIAKKNGNKLPVFKIILATIIFIIIIIKLAISLIDNMALFILAILAFIGVIIYYSIILGIRLRTRMTGWATTSDGRIFKVYYVNNGSGLYFGGVAAGGLVDQLAGKGSNLGQGIGGTIGAAAQIYSINKASKYMSNPEIIAKIVEDYPNVTGAEVYEVLKVYSVTDSKHSIKLVCDYKTVRTGKIKYNKKISVEKSFNQFNDLVNTFNTHR